MNRFIIDPVESSHLYAMFFWYEHMTWQRKRKLQDDPEPTDSDLLSSEISHHKQQQYSMFIG